MKNLFSQKGVAAVEFAIVLPLLLLLLFGIIEFSIICYDKAMITNASREGARRAALFTFPRGAIDVENAVLSYTSNHLITFTAPNTPAVAVSPDFCATSGESIAVTVTYRYTFLLLPALTVNRVADYKDITAITAMRCE